MEGQPSAVTAWESSKKKKKAQKDHKQGKTNYDRLHTIVTFQQHCISMCKQSVRISFNEENLYYCGLSAHVKVSVCLG